MPKEQLIFTLLLDILRGSHEQFFDSVHVIAVDDDTIKLYHSDGFCFESSQHYDIERGNCFQFFDMYDGWDEIGLDAAFDLVNEIHIEVENLFCNHV